MAQYIIKTPRSEDVQGITAAIVKQNDLLEQYFKTVQTDFAPVTTWEGFRNLCRTGSVRSYYKVGDQLQCQWNSNPLIWDIVHIGDAEDTGGNYVILQTHNVLLSKMTEYDAQEALFRTKTEMAAGTYHFTGNLTGIKEADWLNGEKTGWSKNWQFTTTKAIPAGGQICFGTGIYEYADFKTVTIRTYSKPEDTSVLETLSLTEGTDGTNLPTLGSINTPYRICLGYERWSQSGLRQWLNSDKAAGSWWSPQNDFDRPNTYQSIAGFMNGLDSDFLAVVSKSRVTSGINKTIENGAPETVRDKFFIPTRTNINGIDTYISDSSDGAIVWDYYTKFRADEKTGTSNDSDQNRVKTNGSTSAALPWKLRTILPNNVGILLYVSREGACNATGRACGLDCVAPACRIE